MDLFSIMFVIDITAFVVMMAYIAALWLWLPKFDGRSKNIDRLDRLMFEKSICIIGFGMPVVAVFAFAIIFFEQFFLQNPAEPWVKTVLVCVCLISTALSLLFGFLHIIIRLSENDIDENEESYY